MSLSADFFNCVQTEALQKGHPESEYPFEVVVKKIDFYSVRLVISIR
jgi:hypothetical protein